MSDLADISANAVIKPERGIFWRFVGASSRPSAWVEVATGWTDLTADAVRAYSQSRSNHTFGENIVFKDSKRCCGCVVALHNQDVVPRPVWWRVSYFFDRDGSEANVFVWSAPERQFFRRSWDWFQVRVCDR
jgi:hypothetical protein